MPFRFGRILSQEELLLLAELTPGDLADAKRASTTRAPLLRPAFYAELADPADDPGPLPDPDPQ